MLFMSCTGLTSVTIPNSVTRIGNNVFDGCVSLTSITIPDGVTEMGVRVFENCSGLRSVNIPNGVTEIGWRTFDGCSSLSSITIGTGLTKVGQDAFKGCYAIASVSLHCKEIDSWFCGLSSLNKVVIGNEVTKIGSNAFSGCGLTTVTIPSSVKEVGYRCFANNQHLKSASVPSSIKPGRKKIFEYCPNLKAVTVRTGKATRRSTDLAWFKDPTPPSTASASSSSSSSKPSIDPNSMSWPAPDYDTGWKYGKSDGYSRYDSKYVYWSGKFADIDREVKENGQVRRYRVYLDKVTSFKNYNDAEAAAYFYLMYGLKRTRGEGINY